MALGDTNISITAVKTELSSASNKWSGLVGGVGTNKYSFYAPGFLTVDGINDVVLTPPVVSMKIGDFRRYNHASLTPTPTTSFTLGWGPGGATVDSVLPCFPQAMNIKEFAIYGTYVTYKFYTSAAARAAEGATVKTFTTALSFSAITPLAGHTRTTNSRVVSTQTPNVTGIPTATSPLYVDTYISDIAGNRKINFANKANGYWTLTLHEYVDPYAYGANSGYPSPPTGYTAVFASVYTVDNCGTGHVVQSLGSNYSFKVVAHAIFGGSHRTVDLTNAIIHLIVDGQTTVVKASGTLSKDGVSFSGVLSGGATWNYDDAGVVRFASGTTIAASPDYNSC